MRRSQYEAKDQDFQGSTDSRGKAAE